MNLSKSDATGTWFVSFQSDSGPKSVNTGATTREEAEIRVGHAKIAELERQAAVSKLTAETVAMLTAGRSMTVGQALEEYLAWCRKERSPKTVANNAAIIGAFIREQCQPDWLITRIKPDHITAHINRPHLKLYTRKIQRNIISAWMNFCSQAGWIVGNPAARATVDYDAIPIEKKERTRKEIFSEVEIDYMIGRLTGFWKWAVILSADLGIRLSDICTLEWGSFDLVNNRVTIWMHKTRERIDLPMGRRVKSAIAAIPSADKRWVFPEQRETWMKSSSTLSHQFKAICAELNLEGRSFHSLRASYATAEYVRLAAADAGGALHAVSDRLGHRSPKTTLTSYVRTGAHQPHPNAAAQ